MAPYYLMLHDCLLGPLHRPQPALAHAFCVCCFVCVVVVGCCCFFLGGGGQILLSVTKEQDDQFWIFINQINQYFMSVHIEVILNKKQKHIIYANFPTGL